MTTVLTESAAISVEPSDGLHLPTADAERVTRWTLKPEGMCRDEVCVPLPSGMLRHDKVDVAAFWQLLGHPVLHDDAREIWVLGTGAETRNATLADLDAPDFALPGPDGIQRRLSELRGSKVFLTTWASW